MMATRIKRLLRSALPVVSALTFVVVLAALIIALRHFLGVPISDSSGAIGAVGSLTVAAVAVLLGDHYRRRQSDAADAKAELALNVELSVEPCPLDYGTAVEVIVRVRNVSSVSWALPAVYVFADVLDPSSIRAERPENPPAQDDDELTGSQGKNIASFPNTMTVLCPDEQDEYQTFYVLPAANAAHDRLLMIRAEVIGAPANDDTFDKATREKFVAFLDGELVEGRRDGHWLELTADERRARGSRHTFVVFESPSPDRVKSLFNHRVLVTRPFSAKAPAAQRERLDVTHTRMFAGMLQGTMMWYRRRVVRIDKRPIGSVPAVVEGQPSTSVPL